MGEFENKLYKVLSTEYLNNYISDLREKSKSADESEKAEIYALIRDIEDFLSLGDKYKK